jgi:uncharacterized protein YneF (UPF0154 family)
LLALVISDRVWEIIKWPVLIVSFAFVLALVGAIAWGSFLLVRTLWRRLSRQEFAAFALWVLVNFGLTLGATLAIVHRAVSLPAGEHLMSHFLVVWALEWSGPMVVASVLGGLFVFKRSTSWQTLLTWPWLVGVAVGFAYMVGLSGQMDSGSKLCDASANGSCDNAWGLGAWLLGLVAAVVLGGTFVASATLKRVLTRRPRLRRL